MRKKKTKYLKAEEFEEFLVDHYHQIRGRYLDKEYFRWGGWNGMITALGEIQRENNVEPEEFKDENQWTEIVSRTLFGQN